MKFLTLAIIIIFFHSINAQSIVINEVMSSNVNTLEDEYGDYPDWIELYNSTTNPISLNNYTISDDQLDLRKWVFPDTTLNSNEYMIIFASDRDQTSGELHTNFKISSSGEDIILSDEFGIILDQVPSTAIPSDYSYGRNSGNSSEWLFFAEATPGSLNNTQGYSGFSEEPSFSISEGLHNSPIILELTNNTPDQDIYYTDDGTEPSTSSSLYLSPLNITSTTVIRAKSFSAGLVPSNIVTKTYFIGENSTVPIISLTTDPANFFDDDIGIYVEGNGDIPNYRQDWERPIHIEFFEPNGTLGFSVDAGISIHGGSTREYPQKSFSITTRSKYGYNSIPYKIFPNLPYDKYSSILLRMSGGDNLSTHFRDAMMHTLVEDLDMETQAFRPSIVFLNGDYWGVYNIREKIEKEYLAQHHNVDEDNLDLLKGVGEIFEGSTDHYFAMFQFIENNDLSIEANYNYVTTQMEIDNYIGYMLSEMYFTNTDWFPNNMKYWRPRTTTGKWRWILFDIDHGFNLLHDNTSKNMISYVSFTHPSQQDRHPSAIFNKLKLNPNFRNKFINTFADYSNTIFKSENVNSVIDSIKNLMEPEILRHFYRWGDPWQTNNGLLYWHNRVDDLIDYSNNRIAPMWQNFISEFQLSGKATVNINISNQGSGRVQLNSLVLNSSSWTGEYFINIPIKLKAIPAPGYEFIGWSGDVTSTENLIYFTPSANNSITANFQISSQSDLPKVVINEINYNSGIPNSEDWVEIYNFGDEEIELSNWVFKDSDDNHIFTIPDGTFLQKENYLVLCDDLSAFLSVFPTIQNAIGNLGFGFSGGGELLRLFDYNGILIDSVEYDDATPWPIEPDGNGPTLELIHPQLDNALGNNWGSSLNNGTPGRKNDSFLKKSTFNISLFLEGSYSGSNQMNSTITNQLPSNQPFSITPWQYLGKESIPDLSNTDIVDWILIELRSGTSSDTEKVKKAALVDKYGRILEVDGKNLLSFYGVETGDYYIVVHHRNHLSIMSEDKIHVD